MVIQPNLKTRRRKLLRARQPRGRLRRARNAGIAVDRVRGLSKAMASTVYVELLAPATHNRHVGGIGTGSLLLDPETSCEMRNLFLDRNLLVPTMAAAAPGKVSSRSPLCLGQFAFQRDALMFFAGTLDAIFERAPIVRELFGHS